MLTRFEHFAVTEMLGSPDTPPRLNGRLCFAEEWERQAFGVALALAKAGHFEWEAFRENLIAVIGEWERTHDLDDETWNYYDRWLEALERTVTGSALVTPGEIDARLTVDTEAGHEAIVGTEQD